MPGVGDGAATGAGLGSFAGPIGTGIGALIGGGLGLLGASSSARDAQRASDRANALSYQMFNEQHNWEEGMSNTAWQRSARDMRLAGFNPAVMVQGAGGPASTPGGGIPGVANAASEVAASGLEAARIKKDFVEQVSRIQLNNSLAEKADQETDTSAAQARRLDNEIKIENRAADRADEMTAKERAQATWEAKHVPRWLDAVGDRLSPVLTGGLGYAAGRRSAARAERAPGRKLPSGWIEVEPQNSARRSPRTSNVDFYPGGSR